jgi:hypothetical protein
MDQQTFEELLEAGEIGLILMDGGKNLTKEQMERVKSLGRKQSREKLLDMSMELANKPGYSDFMSLPLVSTIMSGRRKPETTEDMEKSASVSGAESPKKSAIKKRKEKTPNKNPDASSVSPGVARPLKFMDSDTDILGKMYNQMRNDRTDYLKKLVEEDKYEKKLENMKNDQTKELIDIFSGKTKTKKRISVKKTEQAKTETKKQTEKAIEKETKKEVEQTKKEVEKKVTAEVEKKVTPEAGKKITAEAIKEAAPSVSTATKIIAGATAAGVGLAPILAHAESGDYNQLVYPKPKHQAPTKASLTTMTIGEVIQYQDRMSKSGDYPSTAVGKYQIIQSTLKGALTDKKLGLKSSDLFDKNTQDKIYYEYLTGNKRPDVGNYLSGKTDDLEKAQMGLAMEFASFGVPRDVKKGEFGHDKKGNPIPARDLKKNQSFYSGDGTNKASVTSEQSAKGLMEERDMRMKNSSSPVPSTNDTGNKVDSSSRENRTLKRPQTSGNGGDVSINTINNINKSTSVYEDTGSDTNSVLEQQQFQ